MATKLCWPKLPSFLPQIVTLLAAVATETLVALQQNLNIKFLNYCFLSDFIDWLLTSHQEWCEAISGPLSHSDIRNTGITSWSGDNSRSQDLPPHLLITIWKIFKYQITDKSWQTKVRGNYGVFSVFMIRWCKFWLCRRFPRCLFLYDTILRVVSGSDYPDTGFLIVDFLFLGNLTRS